MRYLWILSCVAVSFILPALRAAEVRGQGAEFNLPPSDSQSDYPKVSQWKGVERLDFLFEGRPSVMLVPQNAAAGKPWIWHLESFELSSQVDVALAQQGFHVLSVRLDNLYGSPKAMEWMDKIYHYAVTDYRLNSKVVLEGVMRGGLFTLNWAALHPDRVACIYNDAPVCDFKSWPRGKGTLRPFPTEWQRCLQAYGFTETQAEAYKLNPVDNLAPLAAAKIPLLHVASEADEIVPYAENTKLVEERYRALGGPVTVILKPGARHQPYGLRDPASVVDFIWKHAPRT